MLRYDWRKELPKIIYRGEKDMDSNTVNGSILNDTEKRMLKRYYICAKIAKATLGVLLVVLALMILFPLFSAVFLESKALLVKGFGTALILTMISIVAFTCSYAIAVIGLHRKKYKAVLQKVESYQRENNLTWVMAGAAGQAAGRFMSHSNNENTKQAGKAIEGISSLLLCFATFRSLTVIAENIAGVMQRANVARPNMKWCSLAIWITPILVMNLAAVPELVDSYQSIQEEKRAASVSWHALKDYFQQQGFTVRGEDPDDGDSGKLGYSLYVEPYAEEIDGDTYVNINVARGGAVMSVTYYVYLNVHKDKSENLHKLNHTLSMMNEQISQATRLNNIRVTDPHLLEIQQPVLDRFTAQFESGSYYQSFKVKNTDESAEYYLDMEFQTQPKESFTEYTTVRAVYYIAFKE